MKQLTTEEMLETAKQGMQDLSKEWNLPKDNVTSFGVTEDYFHYELHYIEKDMQRLTDRVARFSKVLEGRREDHLSVIDRLLKENKELRDWKKEFIELKADDMK